MNWITALRTRLIFHLQQRRAGILLLSLLIGALTGLAVVGFIVVTERLGMRLYRWATLRGGVCWFLWPAQCHGLSAVPLFSQRTR